MNPLPNLDTKASPPVGTSGDVAPAADEGDCESSSAEDDISLISDSVFEVSTSTIGWR